LDSLSSTAFRVSSGTSNRKFLGPGRPARFVYVDLVVAFQCCSGGSTTTLAACSARMYSLSILKANPASCGMCAPGRTADPCSGDQTRCSRFSQEKFCSAIKFEGRLDCT
jgi:hypothetical protein